jgi:flagellar protein FlaG
MINAITGVPAIITNPTENTKADANQKNNNLAVQEQNQNQNQVNTKTNSNVNADNSQTLLGKVSYSDLADNIKSLLDLNNVTLKFKVDDVTKKTILQIIDSKTKEVIQQVPPEISLKIARFIAEQLGQGQVTNAKI